MGDIVGLLQQNGFDNIKDRFSLVSQGITCGSYCSISTSGTAVPSAGPSGIISRSLRIGGGGTADGIAAIPTGSTDSTLVCQFHFSGAANTAWYLNSAQNPLLCFEKSGTKQIRITAGTYNSGSGVVHVRSGDGATLLGSGTTPITSGTNYYLSVKIVFHATAGSVEVKVNNVTEVYVSGINTMPAGSAYADTVKLGCQGSTSSYVTYFDNFILCDSMGTRNNDFFNGVVWLLTKPAAADTAQADWSLSTGASGYALVDDTTQDDDTTYIYDANVVDDESRFTFGSFSGVENAVYVGGRIIGVSRVDSGTVGTKMTAEYGGNSVDGDEMINATTYLANAVQFETSPGTSTALSETIVNNLSGGIKISSAA